MPPTLYRLPTFTSVDDSVPSVHAFFARLTYH